MQSPDEKDLQARLSKIKNTFSKSIDHMNQKLQEVRDLEKSIMEHMKVCNELAKGMPLPDDPQYQNKKIILDSNQRKILIKFKKHLKVANRDRERMKILLEQINIAAQHNTEQGISVVAQEKEFAKSIMMDTIKNEAYRLAQDKINNRSDKA